MTSPRNNQTGNFIFTINFILLYLMFKIIFYFLGGDKGILDTCSKMTSFRFPENVFVLQG